MASSLIAWLHSTHRCSIDLSSFPFIVLLLLRHRRGCACPLARWREERQRHAGLCARYYTAVGRVLLLRTWRRVTGRHRRCSPRGPEGVASSGQKSSSRTCAAVHGQVGGKVARGRPVSSWASRRAAGYRRASSLGTSRRKLGESSSTTALSSRAW